jgi:hypothetical protein
MISKVLIVFLLSVIILGHCVAQVGSFIKVVNGVPTLHINNKAVAPISLFIYNSETTVSYNSANWLTIFKSYVDKAKNTGVTYLSFELYFHSPMFATTTQPGVIGSDLELTKMDELFNYAQQRGIYLLPTIWVSNPPEWWISGHMDALQIGYDETSPPIDIKLIGASFNNPDYWKIMDEYVRIVIERYKSHPALLGWSPCVGITRENNYGPSYLSSPFNPPTSWADYSAYAQGRFRAWLTEKYSTNATLQSAWNNATVTLTSAELPKPLNSITFSRDTIGNGAGDTRMQMKDWLQFRLDEKGKDWKHVTDLVKSYDPSHIIVMNPADPLFAANAPTTKNGAADGPEWTRYPNVDMVIFHPRISYNEAEGNSNTQNYTLFAFIAYARHLGKIATFSFEDTGDMVNGGNVESYERIRSLAPMVASAGGSMGWVIESSRSGLPVWSDLELAEIGKYTYLFDPANCNVTIPQVAILVDPRGAQTEYTLGGALSPDSRSKDRTNFYATLYNAGIEIDPLEVAEVAANPQILDNYKGVIVADIARLNTGVAQLLYEYGRRGQGLFIGGRTGIFDSIGNNDYSALKTLLGLSSLPTSDMTSYASWSFNSSSDPLLSGLAGQQADTKNHYYIPIADWASEGYTKLGHATQGTQPATILAKNKTVVWFPRLDLDKDSLLMVKLFQNWMTKNLTLVDERGQLPIDYVLDQNYPNPFNPSTNIIFEFRVSGYVSLKVYDVLGREVATLVNEYRQAGRYEVNFDAKNISGGVYYYRLNVSNFLDSKKMILLK